MPWTEIRDTFFNNNNEDDDATQRESRSTVVLVAADHAVKIYQNHDPEHANELAVSNKLNELAAENLTHVFNFVSGYILSMDLPPYVQLKPLSVYVPSKRGYMNILAHHYVYVFSQPIQFAFEKLPDEPKLNEDFYFEILIGIYYARKRFKFCHSDIHEGNLMYNWTAKKATRSYRIGDFFVTIHNTHVEPKLVDYGKSVADPSYEDVLWKEERFKKFWNKSDIYHLSLIISHRVNLTERFRKFLEGEVMPKFRSAMYATRLEKDSAANDKNIEDILLAYFGASEHVNCLVCGRVAEYQAVGNKYFCGEGCRGEYE